MSTTATHTCVWQEEKAHLQVTIAKLWERDRPDQDLIADLNWEIRNADRWCRATCGKKEGL